MKRFFQSLSATGLRAGLLVLWLALPARAATLTTLDYRLTGSALRVSPSVLSVPKGIAGSVSVEVIGDAALADHAYVEATLRGPSLPARLLVGAPGQPLLLPPLPLVGDYQLDNIRLVDAATLSTRLEGTPASVPVRVFDEVLVSKVTSRPLTSAEIQERGIVIDENNFRAVEFEVGFVLDGRSIPVRLPVVTPTFRQSTEIIPTAELEERLKQAERVNQDLSSKVQLPPELETARLNIQVQAIGFQEVDAGEAELGLAIPPIPALMVIPGDIGFLHQFFSVQLFTENAAPTGSGLSVLNVRGELVLPPGPDGVVSTEFTKPGDDPLRYARVGPSSEILRTRSIVRAGVDGKFGTADDVGRLLPGEGGQAEFLVEGLQEGLHVMEVKLTADLEGLAAGIVKISGKAAGSVLVRNPKFSLSFSHPRTVRSGEPYEASVTVLNTGSTPANRARVTLPGSSLSGAVFEGDQAPTVELGDILPGQSATARYRLRAQRTGEISFSNLTTGDDATAGSFRLTMGVDERGVALSRDSLALPDFTTNLPPCIRIAADRVLGQALSVATAGQVPAGVSPVVRSTVTQRALELAEAGQRLYYGDSLARVLADLLLDWQGGRGFQVGWDQILRETQAGREWRSAIFGELAAAGAEDATALLSRLAPDLAGRGERWALAAFSGGAGSSGEVGLQLGEVTSALEQSRLPGALSYGGDRGGWLVARDPNTNGIVRWRLTNAAPARLLALLIQTNGNGVRRDWTLPNGSGCHSWALAATEERVLSDPDCSGLSNPGPVAAAVPVTELPPEILSARQDLQLVVGRPAKPCVLLGIGNYANVLAVLFSKPMRQDQVNQPAAYTLDNGNSAASVQVQQGGRVALLTLRQPIGGLIPRRFTVGAAVTDPRGNPMAVRERLVVADYREGVEVRGRVVRATGTPVVGVPVTLVYNDKIASLSDCELFVRRPSQVFTDAGGNFAFDFVLAGIPFTLATTDTTGLSPEATRLILESVRGTSVEQSALTQLATDPGFQQILLSAFNAGSFDQAVARAEGLDRATFDDTVTVASRRSGTTVPVVLTFRGRATVTGQIVEKDAVTPVPGAAVNLFPDPGSRELGRGVFADADGRFSFFGVPLGVFGLDVKDGRGFSRQLSGALDVPGETRTLKVVLNGVPDPRGTLNGRVTEVDNETPHSGAQVYLRLGETTVRLLTTDANGAWTATDVPVGAYRILVFSSDGRTGARREAVPVTEGVITFAQIALPGTSIVRGRVLTASGDRPVAGAVVAGGSELTRTDADGFFIVEGVPVGRQQISVGVERTRSGEPARSDPAFDFPRFGGTQLDVLPGDGNFVVVRLEPAARVVGRVLLADGKPKAGAFVCHPVESGFEFVEADAEGRFEWEGLPLGKAVQLSAPGENPPINSTAVPSASAIREDPEAALKSAVETFLGVKNPFLNGAGAEFSASTFDETAVTLNFDGETREVLLRMRPVGRIAGKVLNGQGVPIGAKVRVTGDGLSPKMDPGIVLRGDANSDPASGEFSFNGVCVGNIQVQAASPFFPQVLAQARKTSSIDPNATDIVLQFPGAREVNGRLAGRVFEPDGVTLVGAGVKVAISFGDLVITTEADGHFDTRFGLPALSRDGGFGVTYSVEASNPATGLRGRADVIVMPSGTNTAGNSVDVRLLGKGGLRVQVVRADGSPVVGAALHVAAGGYPQDHAEGTTGPGGQLDIGNLFEGAYSLSADFTTGATRVFGRSAAAVTRNSVTEVLVRLEPTASVRGRFVLRDGVTPVPFAQVSLSGPGGGIGTAPTDADGRFLFEGVPLGGFRLVSNDPITGRAARLNFSLSVPGETQEVLLIEQSLSELSGTVINSSRTGPVAGARVEATSADFSGPSRSVTTGPDGRYSFVNVPAGTVNLRAVDPIVVGLEGVGSVVVPENQAQVVRDIELEARAVVSLQVFRGDRSSPGTNVAVAIGDVGVFNTDTTGRITIGNLPLTTYQVRLVSKNLTETRNGFLVSLPVTRAGNLPVVELVLPGVGEVGGRVLASDGTTPVRDAVVTVRMLGPLFKGEELVAQTSADGRFRLGNIALGPYRVTAQVASLSAQADGSISRGGEVDDVALTLFPSGTVIARLLRADGTTPVTDADVFLGFTALGASEGRTSRATGADGRVRFTGVPLGEVNLEAQVARFGGIVRARGQLTKDGQELDLGDQRLDEALPEIVSVAPAAGADNVPITASVELLFSEALSPTTVSPEGVFLRAADGSEVIVTVTLLADGDGILRRVRLTPKAPLRSRVTYQLVVLESDRPGVVGLLPRRAVKDLVGRPLAAPFLATFTTADGTPPQIVSLFPGTGAIQIDPRAVLRASFNESLRPDAVITLTGPSGPVAGSSAVVLGGLAVTFTPLAALDANARYTWTLNNVADLAGNPAPGQPLINSFATLDTLGPEIAQLQIVGGRSPIAGTTVELEALLKSPESGVVMVFQREQVDLARRDVPPFRVTVQLPESGAVNFSAIATDTFGNPGPEKLLRIETVPNQPPLAQLVRVEPASGPVRVGGVLQLRVSATDDVRVTNVNVSLTGALNVSTNLPDGQATLLSFNVPALSVVEVIEVDVTATDDTGRISTTAHLTVPVLLLQPPTIAIVPPLRLAEGASTNLTLTLTSGSGPLARVQFLSETNANISSLGWNSTTNRVLEFDPVIGSTNPVVSFRAGAPGTNEIAVRTTDTNGLSATVQIVVTVLADLDRDGIPDIADADIDGDGLDNARELALGTDPRRVDTDGDTLSDGAEVAAGTNPLLADTDGDGIPDAVDVRPLIPNQAPVAGPDSLSVGRNGSIEFAPAVLLANDSDPENEGVQFVSVAAAVNGTVKLVGATTLRYQAALNFGGTDTFEYTIRDPHGLTAVGRVTVTVAVNHAPDALPTNVTVRQADFVTVSLAGTDLENDPLTFVVRALPAHGQLFQTTGALGEFRGARITQVPTVLTGSRSRVQYVPNPAYFGDDGFQFHVNDGEFDSAAATVAVTVTENPLADSDGDGIVDRDDPDIDGDGLSNEDEVARGTDPRNRDTDGDGWPDGVEVEVGSDPLLATSTPAVFAVSDPSVGLVLPAAPVDDLSVEGIVVSRPVVTVLLPMASVGELSTDEIILSQPVVQVLLPAVLSDQGLELGTLVSEPTVNLLLPAPPDAGALELGTVISEPTVVVMLPAAPEGDLGGGDLVMSQPTVFLNYLGDDGTVPTSIGFHLMGDGRSPTGAFVGPRIPVRLQRVELQAVLVPARSGAPAASPGWNVVLDWSGPTDGRFVVEASLDLQNWSEVPAEPRVAPNGFRAECTAERSDLKFFRVRLQP